MAASPQGGPPEVPKKTEKVLQMSKILNPDALAPGKSLLHPRAGNLCDMGLGAASCCLLRCPSHPLPLVPTYINTYPIFMLYTQSPALAAGPPWPHKAGLFPTTLSLPS